MLLTLCTMTSFSWSQALKSWILRMLANSCILRMRASPPSARAKWETRDASPVCLRAAGGFGGR